MPFGSSQILRYHATANCSYQSATIPAVSMHNFLHLSSFIEAIFFSSLYLFSFSFFALLWLQTVDRWKIYHNEVWCIHVSFIIWKHYYIVSPNVWSLTHCTQCQVMITWPLARVSYKNYLKKTLQGCWDKEINESTAVNLSSMLEPGLQLQANKPP